MTLADCARLVAAGDPDRFRAAMAAPLAAREALLPLYAFNLEAARAAFVAREPMVALMRLQFWRDVLEEAATGKPPRAHEVAEPLARLIQARGLDVAPLDALLAARMEDAAPRALTPPEALAFAEATAGNLMVATCAALGETALEAVRRAGAAGGAAAWLLALPRLAPLGRGLRGRVEEVAEGGLAALAEARVARVGPGVPALRAQWWAERVLRAGLAGRLREPPEGWKRRRLLWLALTRRW